MNFTITTERLTIQPFSNIFLETYYKEFTDEIAKYQYPDRFPSIASADKTLSKFIHDMAQGDMLELVILTHDGEFIGSLEAFAITEKTPEPRLWLKSSAHGKGYGYEALNGLVNCLNSTGKYQYYIYEVDVRNAPSIHLVEKFHYKKGSYEEVTTGSGKILKLQTYYIFD